MGRKYYSEGSKSVSGGKSVSKRHKKLKRKTSFAFKFFMVFSSACLLSGLGWFGYQTMTRYDGSISNSKSVDLRVSNIVKQTDTLQYENTEAMLDTYHLSSEYSDDNGTHQVILEENYIDKDLAASKIGENRKVRLDLSTFKPIGDKGLNLWFAIPVCLGLLIYFIAGIVYMKRY